MVEDATDPLDLVPPRDPPSPSLSSSPCPSPAVVESAPADTSSLPVSRSPRKRERSPHVVRREDLDSLSWQNLHSLCCERGYKARRKRSDLKDFLLSRMDEEAFSVQSPVHASTARAHHSSFVRDKERLSGRFPSWDQEVLALRWEPSIQADFHTFVASVEAANVEASLGQELTLRDLEVFKTEADQAKKKELNQYFRSHQGASPVSVVPESTASKRPISMRWVITFKWVDNKRGVKARLVARGFEDPALRTGSLGVGACMAARLASLPVLLTAATRGWQVIKMDISGAFLKGDRVARDVYLVPPPEARCAPSQVWKANMAVYGLVDAPFEFWRSLDRFLRTHPVWEDQLGWVILNSSEDSCVYRIHLKERESESPVAAFTTHVDDFLFCGHPDECSHFLPLSTSTMTVSRGTIFLLPIAGFGFRGPRRVLFWTRWTRPREFNRLMSRRPWVRTPWSRTRYSMGFGRWWARFCL